MSWETDYFAEGDRIRSAQIAEAEAAARAGGKELFDLARFEAVYNRGSQTANERQHRLNYYVMYPEMRTLAEYAAHLHKADEW